MERNDENLRAPDQRLAAVCGLFCPACTIFIGTREDPERLKALSKWIGLPVEELRCEGCRSEKRCFFCRDQCKMVKCAAAKGLDFCGGCGDYPCPGLRNFQAAMPHRIELWSSLERIRSVGFETWYAEMLDHFSCPQCGAINSAYDFKCRKCGAAPGCKYVALHGKEVARLMSAMKPDKSE
jgi:predicted RNA-binding Zn-ribbon protein involved in translation (DUF1610 family)